MTYPDPEVLNQPVEGRVEVEEYSWTAIIVAWAAGLGIVALTWSGWIF